MHSIDGSSNRLAADRRSNRLAADCRNNRLADLREVADTDQEVPPSKLLADEGLQLGPLIARTALAQTAETRARYNSAADRHKLSLETSGRRTPIATQIRTTPLNNVKSFRQHGRRDVLRPVQHKQPAAIHTLQANVMRRSKPRRATFTG